MPVPDELLDLSRAVGEPSEDLVILAEGNTSLDAGEGDFWIKASGASLVGCQPDAFVRVDSAPLVRALHENLDDAAVRQRLTEATREPAGKLPSVESFMHALLLRLPGIRCVVHTHPPAVIAMACLQGAEARCLERLFPDEVVLCGPATCWVPYVDPGLALAKAMRQAVERFAADHDAVPKTLLLGNHGLITLGRNGAEALGATRMAVKAARVWLGALGANRTVFTLSEEAIRRIAGRPDEHYRQRALWGE